MRWRKLSRSDAILDHDGQTDRQTDRHLSSFDALIYAALFVK